MAQSKKAFGLVHLFVVTFLSLLLVSPFLIVKSQHKHEQIPQNLWMLASIAAIILVSALAYAWTRCSSEGLSYWRGMLVVASSMMAGTSYFSVFFAFPALLCLFLMSVVFALGGDFRRQSDFAPVRFQGLVKRFYEHRLYQ